MWWRAVDLALVSQIAKTRAMGQVLAAPFLRAIEDQGNVAVYRCLRAVVTGSFYLQF